MRRLRRIRLLVSTLSCLGVAIASPIALACGNPDLVISKTGPATAAPGGTITYTLTVKNQGTGPNAGPIIVTDPIPSGLIFQHASTTFASSPGTGVAQKYVSGYFGSIMECHQIINDVQCQIPFLGTPGYYQHCPECGAEEIVINLTFAVPESLSCTTIQNTAHVGMGRGSFGIELNTFNNDSLTVSTRVDCLQGCLTVIKVAQDENGAPLSPVPAFGFSLDGGSAIQNDAQGLALFQGVPPGTHTVSEIPLSGFTQQSVTPAGGVVSVNPGTACAQVTFTNKKNPTTTDIQTFKTGTTTVTAGGGVHYSLSVVNTGQVPAQNVIATDTFPTGFVFLPQVSDSRCVQQQSNILVCTVGTLAPGQSTSLPVSFTVPETHACPQTVTNSLNATTTTTDSNPGNNQSSAQTTVQCPVIPQTDVMIQKAAQQTTVEKGQTMSFVLSVKNNGPASAQNVIVSDPIPSGLTVSSISDNRCSSNGSVITCSFGTMTSGQTIPVTLVFQTSESTQCAMVTNTATVSTTTAGDQTGNNQASAQTMVQCPVPTADLSVTKSGVSTVVRGQTITYTLAVKNNGPSNLSNVKVVDTFPNTILTYQSSSHTGCSLIGSTVECSLGALASGQTVNVTLTFLVPTQNSCTATSVTNTAVVSEADAGVTEVIAENNTSTVATSVTCPVASLSDVLITKSASPSFVSVGQALRFTITISNVSTTPVSGIIVEDTVPSGLSIHNASDGGNVSGQYVRWDNVSLGAASSKTFSIDTTVGSSFPSGTSTITNTALLKISDGTSKSASAQVTVQGPQNPVYPPYFPPQPPPPYYPPQPYYNTPPPSYYPPMSYSLPPVYSAPVIQQPAPLVYASPAPPIEIPVSYTSYAPGSKPVPGYKPTPQAPTVITLPQPPLTQAPEYQPPIVLPPKTRPLPIPRETPPIFDGKTIIAPQSGENIGTFYSQVHDNAEIVKAAMSSVTPGMTNTDPTTLLVSMLLGMLALASVGVSKASLVFFG